MLSEDKANHLAHVILTTIKKYTGVKVTGNNDERVLKAIKQVVTAELMQEQEIDRTVKAKLASYSRGIVEGSAEWDILYRKTFEEEMRKQTKV
jgi:hypothetical protein